MNFIYTKLHFYLRVKRATGKSVKNANYANPARQCRGDTIIYTTSPASLLV